MAPDEARTHWEAQAEAWLALTRSDPDFELFNKPSFLDLVPRPGRLTLDVGCGEGRLARELAALGHHVVGVDGSTTLARSAGKQDPATSVAVADVTRLPFASQVADLVVCFMVLMDVEDLRDAVRELARVLAPYGVVCVAILHPIFTSGLFVDSDPNQTFYMGAYSTEMRHVLDGERLQVRIEHRPIENSEAAGLALTHVREPAPTDAAVAAKAEFARFRRVPEFLHLRAERLS